MWAGGPGAQVRGCREARWQTPSVGQASWPWGRAGVGPRGTMGMSPAPSLSLFFRATWVNLAREWPGTLPPSSKPGRVGGLDPCYPRSHPAGGGGLEVGYMRVAPISA